MLNSTIASLQKPRKQKILFIYCGLALDRCFYYSGKVKV